MLRIICLAVIALTVPVPAIWDSARGAPLKTWDARHDIDDIEVTVVYFVPSDRRPLPDWRERVDYFCQRIEKFHQREFQGQSRLSTVVVEEPFISKRATAFLRDGDGDHTFFQTLGEIDRRLKFATGERKAYPILLALSDMNWRALDDFYRLRDVDGQLKFEGNLTGDRHFPGAASGGARASYLAERGVGWGLVSADGWRVPYSGSDCVVYHEGVGHTVGLPHPQPGNGSVMSLGQYRGWLNESWLDDDQKQRLGWEPSAPIRRADLFSTFTAVPKPLVPQPDEEVRLQLNWPAGTQLKSFQVRLQTDLWGPWIEQVTTAEGDAPKEVPLESSIGPLRSPIGSMRKRRMARASNYGATFRCGPILVRPCFQSRWRGVPR